MKRITREWLRLNNACCPDEKIADLVPPEGLTRDALIAFAHACAERARGYAYAAANADAYAANAVVYAAASSSSSARDVADADAAERSAPSERAIERGKRR